MSDAHGGGDEQASLATICRHWFGDLPLEVAPLASSGFSGARVLGVRPAIGAEQFVLKAFHAGTSRDHAEWVHRLAGHLRARGITQVPEVMTAREGGTVVADASGTLWELCRLMPGVSVTCPDPRQAAAAGEVLARLHVAAATFAGAWRRTAPSPGILRRIEQARSLQAMPWEARRGVWRRERRGSRSDVAAALEQRFDAAIDLFAAVGGARFVERVARLRAEPLSVQPVLRDIWCDHVLYAAPAVSTVTGIVDLHSAGIDTPATDIARLLGSWAGSAGCGAFLPLERHPAAAEAYARIRPLVAEERRLVGVLHCTAVVFGLDNWFRWTLGEGRTFSDGRGVIARIDRLMQELRPALQGLDDLSSTAVPEGIAD